jgi:predicted AlkP superfamily pyrophosphatase or phosphodiesterase
VTIREGEVLVEGLQPLLPEYGGACIDSVIPPLLDLSLDAPAWMPPALLDAEQVVVLVLDGLGWNQFEQHRASVPTLASLTGRAITSVTPTTTATALTSITTGLAPGAHGLVGYRMRVDGQVLNVLRWNASGRDARSAISPESTQPHVAFEGQRPPVVTRAEFRETGFTRAHLAGARHLGWRMPSTLVAEVAGALRRNEPFIYAYYDGIDKIAHEFGLGEHYLAELRAADRVVADILEVLPSGAALVVISDHGQVDVGDAVITPDSSVLAHVDVQSGEGRFRWLHARPGHSRQLFEAAQAHHSDTGWVVTVDQVIDEGWFGPLVTDAARSRLGDVALVAREVVSYVDPADTGLYELRARHGSLTADEMLVPFLVGPIR